MTTNSHRRRTSRRLTSALVAGSLVAAGAMVITPDRDAQAAECADLPWMDTALSADERAEALLDASSQHQKYRWLVEQPANNPQQTTWSDGVVYPAQVDCTPTVIYANGPEGVHNKAGTTAWPSPISIAATWNLELGEVKAAAHGRETFDNRNAVVLGPGISSARNPLLGRSPEYFGEDALLAGLSAAANVRGLEEGNPDKPVLANVKHYVANEQEFDKELSSSNIDERTLRQVYDLPYEIAVRESDPDSVMCSYNQVNDLYSCENPLLTDNLRDEMGFTGYVMSDFGSVHSTAPSLMAGMDQELNRPVFFTPEKLDAALAAGEITQERIDQAAFNVVRAYIRGGLFDHPIPAEPVPNTSTPEHKALARELAEQSITLLKNEATLPLSGDAPTIAVIGQTASMTPTNGVSAVQGCTQFLPFGSAGAVLNCSALVDPLTAITERAEAAGGTVLYDNGADPASAAAAAAQADVAIVFGYHKMGEDNDLPDLSLSINGDELIEQVAGAADKTVVVVNSGTAVEMPWLDDVDAVFHAFYSGEQGGPALADLLWGDATPSGKLPITLPKTFADTPVGASPERWPGVFSDGSTARPEGSEEIRQIEYSEGLEVGYKWYDAQGIDPLFEFGFGLSYTSFEYSALEVATTSDAGAPVTTVSFDITNTGDVAGTEIPQVYLGLPDAADEPGKRLVGFDRVTLEPGATQRVQVVVDAADSNRPFSVWDVEADEWKIVSGAYDVHVGSSSRQLPLAAEVVVGGDTQAPTLTLTAAPAEADGDNGWYVNPIEITAAATDDVDAAPVVEVNLNGAGWVEQDGPITIDADGEYTLVARASDAAGNVSPEQTWSARVDRTVPEVAATEDAGSVTLTASDATSGVASIDYAIVTGADRPEAWLAYEAPFELRGGQSAVYRAVDVAGNASQEGRISAETAAATLTVSPSEVTAGDTVRVSGSDIPSGSYELVLRSSPVTVGSVSVGADGSVSTSFRVPSSTTTGAHTVQLVAPDGTVVAQASLRVQAAGALASTGGTIGIGIVVLAALLMGAGGALVIARRRAARN